ncbi:hypothetical protein P8S55_15645 [Halomonas sp. M1]|uniref:hypothetical protein n=1 Tax=Halomonas sp. M1 TaxID=3035470 RepID=UPI0024866589|nr:hypothetical protein [Halomonas sp. M1]WFE71203.1 hypothetical protein P8S55_15645 [Halomonas sp. M1]
MDKQTKSAIKRPRVLTLCMLAATVSTLALAGCGNNDDELPPAQQPEPMEQDATTNEGQAPAMGDEPAMTDDPGMQDPTMDDPALDDNATSSQEPMPGEESGMNATDPDEEPGFGEGAEPMPGADDDDDELTQGQ